jgi:hypothetical protein
MGNFFEKLGEMIAYIIILTVFLLAVKGLVFIIQLLFW